MKYLLSLALFLLLTSCGVKSTSSTSDTNAANTDTIPVLKPTIFNVVAKSYLYSEPSEEAAPLINEKATAKLGYTDYLSIDPSCVVEITDSTDNWYKIRVKVPEWLRNSHIGWVKKEVLESPDEAELNLAENIDYHFLKRSQQGNMKNLYFSYYHPFDEESLQKVAKHFKNKHCPDENCNIYIYDTKDLMDIIDKYPLSDKEYLDVADHFIYMYDFSQNGQFYPFQDIKYKELGGTNWKKKPL